jgi:hypothetical protein
MNDDNIVPLKRWRDRLGKIHASAKQMLLRSQYVTGLEKASAEALASFENEKRIFRSIVEATEPSTVLNASKSEIADLMHYVESLSRNDRNSLN